VPKYSDPNHPQVEAAANNVLRAALYRATEDGLALSELWDIFIQEIQQHQHGAFVDSLITNLKDDLVYGLKTEYATELRELATQEIREEIRREIEADLREEILSNNRMEIEAEAREKLTLDLGPHIRDRYVRELKQEIRENVSIDLRSELMRDPNFIAQATRELQARIAGFSKGP